MSEVLTGALSDKLPPIDVLLPTHNHLEFTMDAVKALYECTTAPFHLIVMDDSTDGITPLYFRLLQERGVDPLPKQNNITFIHSDVPYKSGNQFFNLGFKKCKYDFVATVMNSTQVDPEWEVTALRLMKDKPKCGVIGFKCLIDEPRSGTHGTIESAGIGIADGYRPVDIGRMKPAHRLTVIQTPPAVQWAFAMLRKAAVVGVLREDIFHGFVGWDDIDNCFELRSRGWEVYYCGYGVGYHKPRATRGSDSELSHIKNMENGEHFLKRWGFWDAACRGGGAELPDVIPELETPTPAPIINRAIRRRIAKGGTQ